jgi:hypothetical protein
VEDIIIKDVNNILTSENANALKNKDSLLIDSGLDSFGYAVLWIELNEKYQCFSVEYVNEIDYDNYRLRDIIERVKNAS